MHRENELAIRLFGDIALNGEFAAEYNLEKLRLSVADLAERLGPADIRVANWEAPLVGLDGANPAKVVALSTNEEAARAIRPLNLTCVSLANNHVFDETASGLNRTITFLRGMGIATVGAGNTVEEARAPFVAERSGQAVVLLAYVDESTDPFHDPTKGMYVNEFDLRRAREEIVSYSRPGATVIVSMHWGFDYLAYPSPEQRHAARRMVEAGADIVFGHHPHCMQGHESWGRGHIFYSLGNFLCGTTAPAVSAPRVSRRTAVVTCRLVERAVAGISFRHLFRSGNELMDDRRGVGPKRLHILSRRLALSDSDYARRWSMTKAFHLFVFRPLEFVRVHRRPLKILAALKLRHVTERFGFLRRLLH
ncbi:MAG: CapA family protein [Pseudomonadota bacterium]